MIRCDDIKKELQVPYRPRRAYDPGHSGYLESDQDYLMNNRFLALILLNRYAQWLGVPAEEEVPTSEAWKGVPLTTLKKIAEEEE